MKALITKYQSPKNQLTNFIVQDHPLGNLVQYLSILEQNCFGFYFWRKRFLLGQGGLFQGGLNKNEIQLNFSNMFSILFSNELYSFA